MPKGLLYELIPGDYLDLIEDETRKGEELAQLRPKLEGNEVFARSRGTWSRSLEDHARGLINDSEDVDDLNERADQFCKDFKMMMALEYRLLLQKHYAARLEFRRALTEQDRLLPNETFPFGEKEAVTMVMFKPQTTLLLMEWIAVADSQPLFCLVDDRDLKIYGGASHKFEYDLDLAKRLLEALPSLKPLLHHRRGEIEWVGSENNGRHRPVLDWRGKVMAAYALDVLTKYPAIPEACGKVLKSQDKEFKWAHNVKKVLESFCPDRLDVLAHWPYVCSTVFMVKGKQKNILTQFSREQQNHIATWKFEVPKCIGWKNNAVGMHCEAEHETMRKQRPALASRGVSGGWGGMVVPDRDQGLYPIQEAFRYSVGQSVHFLLDYI